MNYLVVANGEPPSPQLLHTLYKKHDQLVAVDGGLYACLQCRLEPHLMIGDFDSVSEDVRNQLSHIPQIYTYDQDCSDLEKTLAYLIQKATGTVTVCGALGKRLDHTLANICILCRYPDRVKFETDTEVCLALPKSGVLECIEGQTLSLIPVCNQAKGVVTHGLKWELSGEKLNKNFFSISNICLQPTISFSFESGDLVVCLTK
jgi:thiamine pyrophosphokinase